MRWAKHIIGRLHQQRYTVVGDIDEWVQKYKRARTEEELE